LYTSELSNHAADPADIGTVWFDDSDAEAKTLAFLASLPDLDRHSTSFLDLGCGNGSLLFALRDGGHEDDGDEQEQNGADKGWRGPMLGVDYSAQSIALADQIASSRSSSSPSSAPITFTHWDVLNGPFDKVLLGAQSSGFDIVLDKGTFDAISLADARDVQDRRPCEGYRDRVLRLVRPGTGRFVITSCNWTEAELLAWFEGGDAGEAGHFALDGRVEYRSFSFGGVKGQTITTLCFRRIS
jgi:SAM-dependent methyltransferase